MAALLRLAVFCVDPDGRISYWNRGAEELFGHRWEHVFGHRASGLLSVRTPGRGRLRPRSRPRPARTPWTCWRISPDSCWAGALAATDRDGTLKDSCGGRTAWSSRPAAACWPSPPTPSRCAPAHSADRAGRTDAAVHRGGPAAPGHRGGRDARARPRARAGPGARRAARQCAARGQPRPAGPDRPADLRARAIRHSSWRAAPAYRSSRTTTPGWLRPPAPRPPYAGNCRGRGPRDPRRSARPRRSPTCRVRRALARRTAARALRPVRTPPPPMLGAHLTRCRHGHCATRGTAPTGTRANGTALDEQLALLRETGARSAPRSTWTPRRGVVLGDGAAVRRLRLRAHRGRALLRRRAAQGRPDRPTPSWCRAGRPLSRAASGLRRAAGMPWDSAAGGRVAHAAPADSAPG